MTFTLNAPNPDDSPAAQQAALSTNTNLINTFFGTDHVPFTDAVNQGEHKQITYTEPLSVAPVPVGTKAALYTATINSETELIYKNSGNTYQLTPPGAATFNPIARARVRKLGGVWVLENSIIFTGVTRASEGEFLFSAPPNTFSAGTVSILATSSLGIVTPGNISNRGIIAVTSDVTSTSIRIVFVTASGVLADPNDFGFSVLVY